MAKQNLLLWLEVDEDELPPGDAYTHLPDEIDRVLSHGFTHSALTLSAVYMLHPSRDPRKLLNSVALNYHHYAVDVRGERCHEPACEQHHSATVLNLHDHKHGNPNPPGIN